MIRPTEVNILGKVYSIEYVDKPSDVDIHKRDSLAGQIDYWSRSIRIYVGARHEGDILDSIIHEVVHGICDAIMLDDLRKDENTISLLALGISDTLVRNGWLKTNEQ